MWTFFFSQYKWSGTKLKLKSLRYFFTNEKPAIYSFCWCWQMRGLPINGIWRGQQHMTLAKILQLPELAYWRIQGGALHMCSLVHQFSSSCSSETDPQADTTSHQPLLASSACSECNKVRSQFCLYHRRLYRPPAAVSKDGLEQGGVKRGLVANPTSFPSFLPMN